MTPAATPPDSPTHADGRSRAGSARLGAILAEKPVLYLLIGLVVILGTSGYSLRRDGVFACPATEYGADRYLGYCQATSYGDYDHGAFWFGLEPAAQASAQAADALFLGTSRMQFGFSTDAVTRWFSNARSRHYLLGFSHSGNHRFLGPLLGRLEPTADVYVINLDLFFEGTASIPARTVMHDPSALARYEQKRLWQRIHERVCGIASGICADGIAFFRERHTGTWTVRGGPFQAGSVAYRAEVDDAVVAAYVPAGRDFLATLPVPRECVVLTYVPTDDSDRETAAAVAAALGAPFVSPPLDGLTTFDGSHLDVESAERWSAAFMAEAAPTLERCLGIEGAAPGAPEG